MKADEKVTKRVTTEDNITYKHFLLKNGLADSMDSYRLWHERHFPLYRRMPPAMQEQQLRGTWHQRFC